MAVLEFRSKAAGGFYMMTDAFQAACRIWGREYSEKGCILPEDLPPLVEKLGEAITKEREELVRQREWLEKRERESVTMAEDEVVSEMKQRMAQAAPMCTRLFPLYEMMQKAAEKKVNVFWGVP